MSWKTMAYASALVLGLVGAANADETVGKITGMDTANLTLTLDDGNTYDFSSAECRADASCAFAGLEVGDDVMVVWSLFQDKRMGQSISPTSN